MANIDIIYKGLTGQRYTLTIDNGQTFTQLKTAIAADEGLNADYYSDVVFEGDQTKSLTLTAATTLATAGAVEDSYFWVVTREASDRETKQLQKLTIAEEKRQADSDTDAVFYRARNVLDIDLLPTKYDGNTIVDNTGDGDALTPGRPWTE